MNDWVERASFIGGLDPRARGLLQGLRPIAVPARTVLFRPGDTAAHFVIVLSGRISVHLIGRTGRELLLYTVTPGETCVQTTLGVLGGAPYTGEAVADTDLSAVMVPPAMFSTLLRESEAFRTFVFKAFADRLADVTFLLECVAFLKVEERLAMALLSRADAAGRVATTHQELATVIGSVREVVSRRLDTLAARGLIAAERGQIRITDREGLARLAETA